MNDKWDNPSVIRQYVDGELNAEQTADFEHAMAQQLELQHAVEFERQLRKAVGRAMAVDAAPAALHDAVLGGLDRLDRESDTPEVEVISSAQPDVAGRIGGERGVLGNPQRANIFAVAASLALVAGAILFGLYVPPIDQWNAGSDSLPVSQAEVPRFFSEEHCKCAEVGGEVDRVQFRDPWTASEQLSNQLGRPIAMFNLAEAGYEFYAGAPCQVCPTDSRVTAHLLYRRAVPGKPAVFASVFAVPAEYGVAADADPSGWEQVLTLEQCKTMVVRHRDRDFIYFLTACDPRDIVKLEASIISQLKRGKANRPDR